MVPNQGSLFLQTMLLLMNQTDIPQPDVSYNYYSLEEEHNGTKCYGMYGCFDMTDPWQNQNRSLSNLPEDIAKIEPIYPFYTREHPTKPKYFDVDDFEMIETAGIDPSKPIYLISHGYMEGGGNPWIFNMAQELLKIEDCTVVIIDWHEGSGPSYSQAVANIRLVGAMTAHLLGEILLYTEYLDHVHCIGHSLGAHLCGYIGYALQKDFNITMGRITGLDPAEPFFSNTQAPVRLDKTAAKYVDVIHTDANTFMNANLGITEKIGHVDYFPNGGSYQPGCDKSVSRFIADENDSFFGGVRKYLGCNHIRSHEIFTESINPQCSFLTVSCPSFEDFKKGRCFECGENGHKCLKFGYHGKKHYESLIKAGSIHPSQGMVQYLLTGDKKPFCKGHYKVSVKVSESQASKIHGGEIGQVIITLHTTSDGKGHKSEPINLINDYHEPGLEYTIVMAGDEVTPMRAIEVLWKYEMSPVNPFSWRLMSTPRIFLQNITVHALESSERITVCPKISDEPLLDGYPELMIPAYC